MRTATATENIDTHAPKDTAGIPKAVPQNVPCILKSTEFLRSQTSHLSFFTPSSFYETYASILTCPDGALSHSRFRTSPCNAFRSFSHPSFTRACNSAKDHRAVCDCVAIHTTSHGTGMVFNSSKNNRMRRLKRLRTTAEPVFLEATIPMRYISETDGRQYNTNPCKRTRNPLRYNA